VIIVGMKETVIRKHASVQDLKDNDQVLYTRQEVKVAELSTRGKSDAEIARILKTTPKRIRAIKEMIIAKVRANIRGC
jgi:DNA-binding CsgD family transcriptional regulator